MLNLDGVDLILPDPEGRIERFIRDEIPLDSFRPWLRDTWPGFGTAGIAYPTGHRPEPSFRLNRFHWPWGVSRWAFGHFLASSDQVETILADAVDGSAYATVPFIFGTPETNEQVETDVYVLPPTPLSGIRGLSQEETGTESLYLLTIVDQRYMWWFTNVGNLQITSSSTWVSLYENFKTILEIDFEWDTINSAYLAPSTAFNLPYEPLPIVMDAVAYNVGQRIVANYDGSIYAQNYQTALTAMQKDFSANSGRNLVAGGYRFSDPL